MPLDVHRQRGRATGPVGQKVTQPPIADIMCLDLQLLDHEVLVPVLSRPLGKPFQRYRDGLVNDQLARLLTFGRAGPFAPAFLLPRRIRMRLIQGARAAASDAAAGPSAGRSRCAVGGSPPATPRSPAASGPPKASVPPEARRYQTTSRTRFLPCPIRNTQTALRVEITFTGLLRTYVQWAVRVSGLRAKGGRERLGSGIGPTCSQG